jgi:large subunit ribosomal protein L16
MPLMPKRVKHRKIHRGKLKGNATRGHFVAFGDYGLQSLDHAWLASEQLEAARIACGHVTGGEGKLWFRIFPHKAISAKPAEVRMGTGKGEPEYYAAIVKPGTIIAELGGVPEDVAKTALNRMSHKFPVKCRLVRRRLR